MRSPLPPGAGVPCVVLPAEAVRAQRRCRSRDRGGGTVAPWGRAGLPPGICWRVQDEHRAAVPAVLMIIGKLLGVPEGSDGHSYTHSGRGKLWRVEAELVGSEANPIV
jgi:hypothetical protein